MDLDGIVNGRPRKRLTSVVGYNHAEEVARAWPILGRRTSVEEARSIGFVRAEPTS